MDRVFFSFIVPCPSSPAPEFVAALGELCLRKCRHAQADSPISARSLAFGTLTRSIGLAASGLIAAGAALHELLIEKSPAARRAAVVGVFAWLAADTLAAAILDVTAAAVRTGFVAAMRFLG